MSTAVENLKFEKIGRYQVAVTILESGKHFVAVKVNGQPCRRRCGSFITADEAVRYVESFRQYAAKAKAKSDARNAVKAKAREEFVNPYKVGDMLVNTWGYDQTNADFVQVVKVGPRSVTVREINSTLVETGFQSMSGKRTPVKNEFADGSKEYRITIQIHVYEGTVSHGLPARHGHWSPISEGESVGVSWYG